MDINDGTLNLNYSNNFNDEDEYDKSINYKKEDNLENENKIVRRRTNRPRK